MKLQREVKDLIQRGRGRFGELGRFRQVLRRYQLDPKSVFDIGVAHGTPWLYDAFPKAHFFLIDPTRESLPHMERWARRLQAEVHNIALSDTAGTVTINLRSAIGAASVFDEYGSAQVVDRYDVPLKRFDNLFGDVVSRPENRPVLVKIDVQGAELQVLRGMGSTLDQIDIMIVEISLIATLRGDAPEFADISAYMHDRGFCLFDVVGTNRRPLDGALAQIDGVFVPVRSPLRHDRRWSSDQASPTPESETNGIGALTSSP